MTALSDALDALEPMFEDPAAGLSKVQRAWWARWDTGAEIDSSAYRDVPAYRVAADAWRAVNGKAASKSREKFLALKRAQQDFYRACAGEHAGRYSANQSTVDAAVLLVIDAEGGVLPRAALLDAGVPADEVARISGKTGARRKVRKALQKHAEHQNAKRMIQNEGRREYLRLATDTLSGSLEGIAVNMKTQARLARLEQSEADHARRIAELEARLAAVEVRHAVEDAGIDPRAEAVRMRQEGMSYGVIAKALGVGRSTAQLWANKV